MENVVKLKIGSCLLGRKICLYNKNQVPDSTFLKNISEKYNTDDKKNDDDAKPEQILYLKSLLQNIELSTTKLNRFLDYLNHIKVTPKVYKRSNIVR